MPFKVGDDVIVIKESMDETIPDTYKEHLDKVFVIKNIISSSPFPYECSTEGVDLSFAFKEEEIKLVNNELAKVKHESKVF